MSKRFEHIGIFVFLGCFWAYVGQPQDHIGWATPMPFASINPINWRTNPWNFHEKILRIVGAGKWGFFESAISKKKFLHLNENKCQFKWGIIYFCQSYEIKSPPWTILWLRILGIYFVENIKRLCVFMFQTWDKSATEKSTVNQCRADYCLKFET